MRISRSRQAHLKAVRKALSFRARRRMNHRLAKLFKAAEVSMVPQVWMGAQKAYVRAGVGAAKRFIQGQAS